MQEESAPPFSFQALRRDAEALLKEGNIHINENVLDQLSSYRLNVADIQEKVKRVSLPLKFGNAIEELNFHAVAALLGFGAAYERGRTGHPSHLQESAKDTILFGLIGLHLTKADLHAGFLLTVSRSDVSSYFGIDPMEMVQHESVSAIQIERPGPLSTYVDDLVRTMNETGQRLRELDQPDLARFLLTALRSGEGDKPTVARMVKALGVAFKGFGSGLPLQDKQGGEGFICHKKALLLAGEVYHRLRHTFHEFDFGDFEEAPGYVTPSVIAHLCRLGVLTAKGGEEEKIQDVLSDPNQVAVLTAASILALDGLASRLSEKDGRIAPLDLSYYFDEVWGKMESAIPTAAASEQSESEYEQQQEEEPRQEQQPTEGEGMPIFIPPREQTVM